MTHQTSSVLAAYTAAGIGVSDTVAASDYRYISVALPLQMGRDIMSKYYENPALFNDPDAFAQYFPRTVCTFKLRLGTSVENHRHSLGDVLPQMATARKLRRRIG